MPAFLLFWDREESDVMCLGVLKRNFQVMVMYELGLEG